jgi:putative PIN family toxin of toxin-antitoxin system
VTVVVADTGIYVSALVFGGVPQTALIQILGPPFSIAVSKEIKAELKGTLTRKFGWPDERVAEACRHLWANALWCEPVAVQASRDPDDDHVLGCALAASAKVIVTGDKDLLTLHPFRGIAIVTPAAFLATEWEDRNDQ